MAITLSDALKMAAPHMAKDDTLRTLCGIKITDGVVMATDRYTAARIAVEGVPDAFVPAAIVKQGVISIADNVATLKTGATIPLPDMEDVGDYPSIEKLFTDFKPADVQSDHYAQNPLALSLNPDMFAKFLPKHFPKWSGSLNIELGETPTKPLRVTLHLLPEFVALWVPMKLG